MKLVKLFPDYFVIKDGDTIVASTESADKVQQLSLLEVKELIGEPKWRQLFLEDLEDRDIHPLEKLGTKKGFMLGWYLREEQNKDKKYTVEDVKKIVEWLQKNASSVEDELAKPFEDEDEVLPETFFHDAYNEALNRAFKSVEPRTEWDVEFVEGELRLI